MITLVGNLLNSNNKKVLDKMNKMDFEFIRREVVSQIEDGAEFIEINAVSLLSNEISFLKEAINIIESSGSKALVRSNNVETLVQVLDMVKNEVVVGDIEFCKEKIDFLLDHIDGRNVKIIAAIKDPKDEEDTSPEKSLLIAQRYVDYLLDQGIKRSDILLDPVVRPLEQHSENGKMFLSTLELFKLDFPQVKTIANLSALSEGLPMRWLISSNLVSLAIEKGLDYIVLDVMEKSIIESIITTLTIIGKDKNMQSYLSFCRNNRESRRNKGL
ncbi:MAG: dihydropteroate synthase [Candidatus Omnitrophota bacterium]